MKQILIFALSVLLLAAAWAGTADENTEYVLKLLEGSKADALQRSMIGLELGGEPPKQRPNKDGEKATYTYLHEGNNTTVWTWKGQVYVIKHSNSNYENNKLDVAAVAGMIGEPADTVPTGLEYNDGTTRLTVKSGAFSWTVELVDLALYEEAGGTVGW